MIYLCFWFWTPSVHLASQSGNKLKFNKEIDAFVPDISKQNEEQLVLQTVISLFKTL